jgi:hypothetical protein
MTATGGASPPFLTIVRFGEYKMITKIHTVRFFTYMVDIENREMKVTLGIWRGGSEFSRERIMAQLAELQEVNHRRDCMATVTSEEVLNP